MVIIEVMLYLAGAIAIYLCVGVFLFELFLQCSTRWSHQLPESWIVQLDGGTQQEDIRQITMALWPAFLTGAVYFLLIRKARIICHWAVFDLLNHLFPRDNSD